MNFWLDATRLLHSGTESRDRFRREPAAFPRSRGTCSRRLSGRRQRTATGAPVRIATTPAGCCRSSQCLLSRAGSLQRSTGRAAPPALFAGRTGQGFPGCHHPPPQDRIGLLSRSLRRHEGGLARTAKNRLWRRRRGNRFRRGKSRPAEHRSGGPDFHAQNRESSCFLRFALVK